MRRDDRAILGISGQPLCQLSACRRVYYSAFARSPTPRALLPPAAPPLVREHRLYQADWLLRFYGFELDEIMAGAARTACSTSASTPSWPGR